MNNQIAYDATKHDFTVIAGGAEPIGERERIEKLERANIYLIRTISDLQRKIERIEADRVGE